MPKVRFEPFAVEIEVPQGTSLLAAADQAAQRVDDDFFYGESCEGRLECGNCCVQIVHGAENLSPAGDQETKLLADLGRGPGWRAACAAKVSGDVVARVPPRPGTEEVGSAAVSTPPP